MKFDPEVQVLRPAQDHELFLVKALLTHVDCCFSCNRMVSMTQAESPCDRGREIIRHVARYMYIREGKIHSIMDLDRTGEKTQIEVPYGKLTVVSLLLRMFRVYMDKDSLVRQCSWLRYYTRDGLDIGRFCAVPQRYSTIVRCEVSREVVRY